MTSLLTNVAAMTALQTLQSTNKAMEATQNRISTGYRVSEASDNAAYWSIATTMRSDNKAMSAVKDALGIGTSVVDTAYTAMTSIKDVLDKMKSLLTTASQDGVERSKVQDEITQAQNQLKNVATTASFAGQNWLSIDSSATGYVSMRDVIASFSRSSAGALSLTTVKIDTSTMKMFDSSSSATGVLEKDLAATTTAKSGRFSTYMGTATNTAGTAGAKGTWDTGATVTAGTHDVTLGDTDVMSFTVKIGSGPTTKVAITKSMVDAALGSTDGVIDSEADYAAVLKKGLDDAGVQGGTWAIAANSLTITTANNNENVVVGALKIESFGAADIDITASGTSFSDIKAYINIVDKAISKVTAAASTLGAVKNRLDVQTQFVSTLMDTLEKGIGTLVDADMTEESTKLKALQTQQQLGVQALSIANSSSQTIMQLFQN
ncbi:MAG: flagellin C [Fulvimarina manganoxydans]|uniref:flagellin N-terminal helical domain-containing protein n=1 Tax=Fulvimarina manganoxydans TaxID=937218 RepID=UPI0023534274|nr:flagellin [Fulvimarina manganoxydans]MCK5932812.1 flagellin C [Fulvimarina manganoxydans]